MFVHFEFLNLNLVPFKLLEVLIERFLLLLFECHVFKLEVVLVITLAVGVDFHHLDCFVLARPSFAIDEGWIVVLGAKRLNVHLLVGAKTLVFSRFSFV